MTEKGQTILLPRAYCSEEVAGFLASTPETILGSLVTNSEMAVEPPQRDAWLEDIAILKNSLQGLDGTLFLEFNILRMGQRIDAVEDRRNHLRNAYRVLLTRAHQGMVIFVPPGAANDPTRASTLPDHCRRYPRSRRHAHETICQGYWHASQRQPPPAHYRRSAARSVSCANGAHARPHAAALPLTRERARLAQVQGRGRGAGLPSAPRPMTPQMGQDRARSALTRRTRLHRPKAPRN